MWILALALTAVGFQSFSYPIFVAGKFTENQFFILSISCAHPSLAKNSWYFLASEWFCTRKADVATEQLFFYKSSHSARFCQVSLGGDEKGRLFEGKRKEETNTSVSLEKGCLGERGLPQRDLHVLSAEARGGSQCSERVAVHWGVSGNTESYGTESPASQTSSASYITDSHGVSRSRGNFSGTENRLSSRFSWPSKRQKTGPLHALAHRARSRILWGKPLNGLDVTSYPCSGILLGVVLN